MFLYKISQNTNSNYDTYDSAVVVAETEEDAQRMYPGDGSGSKRDILRTNQGDWTHPVNVKVELLGTAMGFHEPTVVVASYNAG